MNINNTITDLTNVSNIKQILETAGFFYVKIEDSDILLIEELFEHSRQLFDATDDAKKTYFIGPNGLGYTPLYKTKMPKDKIETRESYTYRKGEMDTNELYDKSIDKLSEYAQLFFCKIIESLGLQLDDYTEAITNNFNTLSLIHYPVIKSDSNAKRYGISEHTDWGFITLLYTNEMGLQVKINGEWVDAPVIPNHFIVNIGNMMEILTNGVYKSTKHRVLIEKEKYSLVFFYEPALDYVVKPYVGDKYLPVKFGDYVYKKIAKIYN
jgi:isopenicillin N synthase-like dioxygenase